MTKKINDFLSRVGEAAADDKFHLASFNDQQGGLVSVCLMMKRGRKGGIGREWRQIAENDQRRDTERQ